MTRRTGHRRQASGEQLTDLSVRRLRTVRSPDERRHSAGSTVESGPPAVCQPPARALLVADLQACP